MNELKFKAFRQTVGFCAIASIASVLVVYLASIFSAKVISWMFITALLIGGFYLMYSVNLSRLEMEERYPSVTKK